MSILKMNAQKDEADMHICMHVPGSREYVQSCAKPGRMRCTMIGCYVSLKFPFKFVTCLVWK